MADLKEQRVCIRFCFLLGKTAAETVTMLRDAFKEEALSQARVYELFFFACHTCSEGLSGDATRWNTQFLHFVRFCGTSNRT
jgi:hypothetical protein